MRAGLRIPRAAKAVAAALALAGAAALVARAASAPAPRGEGSERPVRKVRLAVVKATELPDLVTGFGSLSYRVKADLSAGIDGVAAELPYREGDLVAAGAVVARLRNPQVEHAVGRARAGEAGARAALALAEARLFEARLAAEARLLAQEKAGMEIARAYDELAEAERRHADQEALLGSGGTTEEAVRAGRFSLEAARARIAIMEKDREVGLVGLRDADLAARGVRLPADPAARREALLRSASSAAAAERDAAAAGLEAAARELESALTAFGELTIRAPADGIIVARYVEPGERVKKEDKLVTLIERGVLCAVVRVGEADAMRLAPGMKATVAVDAAGATYDGIVDLVSPIADAKTASFALKVALATEIPGLAPGMFARVSVELGPPRRVLTAPDSSVVSRSGGTGVAFVVASGMAHARRVELGELGEFGRVLLSGVEEGEALVEDPDQSLTEGDYVSIIE